MRNQYVVFAKFKKIHPLLTNIFTKIIYPHSVHLVKEQKDGAVVVEMNSASND